MLALNLVIMGALSAYLTLPDGNKRTENGISHAVVKHLVGKVSHSNPYKKAANQFFHVNNCFQIMEDHLNDLIKLQEQAEKVFFLLSKFEVDIPEFWKVMDVFYPDQLHEFRYRLAEVCMKSPFKTEFTDSFLASFLTRTKIPAMLLVPGLNYFKVNNSYTRKERLKFACSCLQLVCSRCYELMAWTEYWQTNFRMDEFNLYHPMRVFGQSMVFDLCSPYGCGDADFVALFQDFLLLLAKHQVRMECMVGLENATVTDVIKSSALIFMNCCGEKVEFSSLSALLEFCRGQFAPTPSSDLLDDEEQVDNGYSNVLLSNCNDLLACVKHLETTGVNDFELSRCCTTGYYDGDWALKYANPKNQGVSTDEHCLSCGGEGWWTKTENGAGFASPQTEEALEMLLPNHPGILKTVLKGKETAEKGLAVPCYVCNYEGLKEMKKRKSCDSSFWKETLHPVHISYDQERKRVRVEKEVLFNL